MPTDPVLLDNLTLEQSSVVANNAMNRGRGLSGVNSYARELGFDPYEVLAERLRTDPTAALTWIDVCCGSGRALLEAEQRFDREFPTADVRIIGLDLVDFFLNEPRTPRLRLLATSATIWAPPREADLVTCVHGLHYIGDKLALIEAMTSWLVPHGLFAADFDPAEIRRVNGSTVAEAVVESLRAAGLTYDRRRIHGHGRPRFTATYLGADPSAGPGYTGQPSVVSYYDW
ncbi:class I SAM-dependent methyltransferase [Nocardia fluminea]